MKRIIFCLMCIALLFGSCKWKKSGKKDAVEDTVTVTDGLDSVPAYVPFVNETAYFYEDTVKIAGKIERLHDSFIPDTAYILILDTPVEVLPHRVVIDMEDPNIPQTSVSNIHLLLPDRSLIDIERFDVNRVIVEGSLWGRYSGLHYTPVVMSVNSIQLERE